MLEYTRQIEVWIGIGSVLTFLLSLIWFFHIQKKKRTLWIAYGSDTGKTQELAEQLAKQISQHQPNKHIKLVTLDGLTVKKLRHISLLFIITSTHGEGGPPQNGHFFKQQLQALPYASLASMRYAVLATGDSSYTYFCGFGKWVDAQLRQSGAQELFPLVTVDSMYEQDLLRWQQALIQAKVIHGRRMELQPIQASAAKHTLTLSQRQLLNIGTVDQDHDLYQLDFRHAGKVDWQSGAVATFYLHDQQGKEQQREYSIASLPSELTLRFLIRERKKPTGELGLASDWLCHRLRIGEQVVLSIRQQKHFALKKTGKPMIFIGNGTGLAGLRAHIKQRQQQGHKNNWLIYGERRWQFDQVWNQELTQWLRLGYLKRIDLAFSRLEPEQPVCLSHPNMIATSGYVQDALSTQQELLKQWIQQGAYVYVCGSQSGMAQGVKQRLQGILGYNQVQQLSSVGRILWDVY